MLVGELKSHVVYYGYFISNCKNCADCDKMILPAFTVCYDCH